MLRKPYHPSDDDRATMQAAVGSVPAGVPVAAQNYLLAHPGEEDLFPKPVATQSTSYKVVGYFGFGNLGPLMWSGLYGNVTKKHPDNFTTESYQGREITNSWRMTATSFPPHHHPCPRQIRSPAWPGVHFWAARC